jgi:hypothetical protein
MCAPLKQDMIGPNYGGQKAIARTGWKSGVEISAIFAGTVEGQFVEFLDEAGRNQRIDFTAAAVDFKNLGAAKAIEVVVVALTFLLVARGIPWNSNFTQKAFLSQRLDIAIYGRKTKVGNNLLRLSKNFQRTEWPGQGHDDFPDCSALSRISLHGLFPWRLIDNHMSFVIIVVKSIYIFCQQSKS